jgi:hypothetical protein
MIIICSDRRYRLALCRRPENCSDIRVTFYICLLSKIKVTPIGHAFTRKRIPQILVSLRGSEVVTIVAPGGLEVGAIAEERSARTAY